MAWEFESGQPIYKQLIDHIRLDIASGSFKPGDRIPPVRELAAEAGVNPNTMQRALAELERDGLIYTNRTSGRYISEEGSVLKELRKKLGQDYISQLFQNLRKLGLSDEEIIGAVSEWAGGNAEKEANK